MSMEGLSEPWDEDGKWWDPEDVPPSADAWAAYQNRSPYRKETLHEAALRRSVERRMGDETDENIYFPED